VGGNHRGRIPIGGCHWADCHGRDRPVSFQQHQTGIRHCFWDRHRCMLCDIYHGDIEGN
jgi:hypothetical protein